MKKFIVFFLICVFIFTASLFRNEFDFSTMQNLSVQIFTSSKQVDNDYNNIDNGQGQVIFCDYEQYKHLSNYIKDIQGVTFIFDGDLQCFYDVIEKLNVTTVEKGSFDFVGYSNNFDSAVNYNGKKVNVQGYFSNGRIFIGTPLLLGSY